jgi:hypothetical protein
VDYQKQYWVQVFESFMHDISLGLTPNPDLSCNQFIKVVTLPVFCIKFSTCSCAVNFFFLLLLCVDDDILRNTTRVCLCSLFLCGH